MNRRLDELAEVQSHEFRLIMGALALHKRQFRTMQQSMGEMHQSMGEMQQTVGNVQESIGEINETLEQLSSSTDFQAQAMERYNAAAEERFAFLRQVLAEHEHGDPAA
ncbi:hypothetical protein DYH09_19575 [bacterium CPR1]|nr:hypothetical protein [bacterium CPR1]